MFTLKDFKFNNKKVLVRSSLNVSFNGKKISDDFRLIQSIPTIKYLLEKGATVCICGHIGRPKTKSELSCKLIQARLSKLIGVRVKLIESVNEINLIESNIKNKKSGSQKKQVYLLENLRHHKGESKSSNTFAKSITKPFDYFVLDAFDTIHRDNASITKFVRYLPSCMGLLLEKEMEYFQKCMKIKRPFSVILGGVKKEKIDVLKLMLKKADNVMVGGVLANTLLYKNDFDIKDSKIADLSLLNGINSKHKKLILPTDLAFEKSKNSEIAIDIGSDTVEKYISILKKSKTILWIGPTGMFEKYPKNMKKLAKAISNMKATTIIGGGDTSTAINEFNLASKMAHVSTGGGSTLDLLQAKKMPGIEALKTNYKVYSTKSKIFPTVFSTNKKIFDQKFELLNNNFKNIQIDFMDGKFVPNKSVSVEYTPNLKNSKSEYEAHLMINNPKRLIDLVKQKGFSRFIFHFESCKKNEIELIVKECKKKKMKPILAINPNTEYSEYMPYLKHFKHIMFMGVIPGKEGQKLIKSVVEKIRETKYNHPGLVIQIDGGVNLLTAKVLSTAGVSILNSGSFISSSSNPKKSQKLLVEEANKKIN